MRLLRHLLRPARGGAAAVIVVFSVMLTFALRGGLVGIPAVLILASWFCKYAYILFDHTVWGHDEPPVLDIQMLNPVDEQRPLAELVVFPASIAVLGLERNILLAVYPLALARMIRGLGSVYVRWPRAATPWPIINGCVNASSNGTTRAIRTA